MSKPKLIHGIELTQEHIDYLKTRLRPSDIVEIRGLGVEPNEALQVSFDHSVLKWCSTYKGRPMAAYGCVPIGSLLSNAGAVWMLGTTDLEKKTAQIATAKKGINYINIMLDGFDVITNYVHAENTLSLKWLKWMGFRIDKPRKIGINGEFYCRVEKRG